MPEPQRFACRRLPVRFRALGAPAECDAGCEMWFDTSRWRGGPRVHASRAACLLNADPVPHRRGEGERGRASVVPDSQPASTRKSRLPEPSPSRHGRRLLLSTTGRAHEVSDNTRIDLLQVMVVRPPLPRDSVSGLCTRGQDRNTCGGGGALCPVLSEPACICNPPPDESWEPRDGRTTRRAE
ncbi:hypothetical protein LX36DRAFT_329592 [Colletotrichum falcatum]|nr:hypothetical protein LX36DRAFT_329592 [Colletotrichum falcatum]